MTIMTDLLRSYEDYKVLIDNPCDGTPDMLPLSHIRKNMHIEITIDVKGNFVSAKKLVNEKSTGKKDSGVPTIIPAVISAVSRTSGGVAAFPLSDSLAYLDASFDLKRHKSYLELLKSWADSNYSDEKIIAVFKYIESGSIINDLFNVKILKLKDGEIDSKDYKFCVRWVVKGGSRLIDACFQDAVLFNKWISFYDDYISSGKEINVKTGFDMLSGCEEVSVAKSLPKGVLSSVEHNAKLISFNNDEEKNFVFRERFLKADEACTVSYENFQKIHCMLEWLGRNPCTSISIGDSRYVFWCPDGKLTKQNFSNPFVPVVENFIPSDYLNELKATFNGYRNAFDKTDRIIVAGFDAATTGRLSVVYYNSFSADIFFERLDRWFKTCAWVSTNNRILTPSFYNIVCGLLGTEKNGVLKISNAQSKLLKNLENRLIKCFLENERIPLDFVKVLVEKASSPQSYSYKAWLNKVVFTACAVLHKYYVDWKKEDIVMSLDLDNTDRSYLYGRLLAVFEKVERDTYGFDGGRVPNALKYFNVYSLRPYVVSGNLYKQIVVYLAKLAPGLQVYYQNIIGDIMDKLSKYDINILNKSLEPSYLFGYYLQRNSFYSKKKEEDVNND